MLRTKLSAISLITTLATFLAPPVFAATNPNDAKLEQLMKQFTQQMSAMQHQVNSLQSEVVELKGELRVERAKHITKPRLKSPARPTIKPIKVTVVKNKIIKITSPQAFIAREHDNIVIPRPDLNGFLDRAALRALYIGGMSILTSPYIGVNSAFDGSDLVANAPTINLDLRLLKQEQALQQTFIEQGFPLPQSPILVVSGKIEAQAITNNVGIPGTTSNTFNLSSANVDIFAQINHFVSGYMSWYYDNSLIPTSATRVVNSRIFLDQGFITLGNLHHSPVYSSFGQIYMPFGQYTTYMLTSPLTDLLGRVLQRGFVLGIHPDLGFYVTGYAYQNATDVNGRMGGGGNMGFKAEHGIVKFKAQVGMISNIAESLRMQANGAPFPVGFGGFGVSNATEQLRKAVPAFNANAQLDIGPFSLISEYVAAVIAFNPLDLSFNGSGAKPNAIHAEAAVNFDLHGHPSSFALGYDYSGQALALLIPKDVYSAAFNISLCRDTILSLEFQHSVNYASTDLATGTGSLPFSPLFGVTNSLILQFGIYF